MIRSSVNKIKPAKASHERFRCQLAEQFNRPVLYKNINGQSCFCELNSTSGTFVEALPLISYLKDSITLDPSLRLASIFHSSALSVQ